MKTSRAEPGDEATKSLAAGNRSGNRVAIDPKQKARVEASIDRRPWRLPLVDISETGLCFECPDELPLIVPGASVDDVVVRAGDRVIRGSMVIAHFTSSLSTGTLCGARFRPSTEADRARLRELLDRAEPTAPPSGAGPPGDSPARGDVRPLECRHCRANLENVECEEASVCPYCLRPPA